MTTRNETSPAQCIHEFKRFYSQKQGKPQSSLMLVSITLIFSLLTGCTQSTFKDISPNQASLTSAGLTLALDGDDGSLFAVSLNAGIWHRTVSASGKAVWNQLSGPRHAVCIAVDPANPRHLAAGERDGDARENRLNECGLWESRDSGRTWINMYNPMEFATVNAGSPGFCQSQVINAVVFTASSGIVFATTCGIVRKGFGIRHTGSPAFVPAIMPPGVGMVTAIVSSPHKVWARTGSGVLLVSTDDGISFKLATVRALPPGTRFDDRGDPYSLAASDDMAMMSGCCITGGPAPVHEFPANELVIYHTSTDSWSTEFFTDASGKTIVSGTYVGGRRFVKSFLTPAGTRFFFCNGQATWEVNGAGNHNLVASTGVDIAAPSDPSYAGGMHTDVWDFSLDKKGTFMWLACDGGVYENRLDGKGWKASFDGLHTQHVQSLNVVWDPKGTLVSYGTQDNYAWSGKFPSWNTGGPGDVNWTDADAGTTGQSFYFRSFGAFDLVQIDGSLPSISGEGTHSIITDPHQPDRPGLIQFIQTIAGEPATPLDAYQVVQRPVMNKEEQPTPIVPPPALAGIDQPGNPWLLRNRQWATDPDFYRGITKGNWVKELDDLPPGTERVLTSGGHSDTHYFAVVRDQDGLSLYERIMAIRPKRAQWVKVFKGIIEWTNHCQKWEGWYGPVFVNPYDDSKVYLLAADGVKVSHRLDNGSLVFENDDVLTALITGSGTYPIVRQFCGGNSENVVFAARMLGNNTLGNVSFFRDDPKKTIVSSPFTGVFYDCGDRHWRSFSNLLPPGYVWVARMDKSDAYLGFAGRSIGMVKDIDKASLATYFIPEHKFLAHLGGGQLEIASLQISNGTPAADRFVTLKVVAPDGKTTFWDPAWQLDNDGKVVVPISPFFPGSVVHLHFTGSEKEGLATSEIHFVL